MTIASEITRLQGAKANLKTSIEAKGVTVPSSATIDTYSGYVDQIQTSSSIVNGVIESYLASTSTVAADTFVEFVSSSIDYGTDTQLSSTTNSASVISATKLDDSTVFIAHSYTGNSYLYGIVVTVSGGTVTAGTDTQLSTTANTGSSISVVTLDSSTVFIAHDYGSNHRAYGMVCTVSGTTITAGTDTELHNANFTSGLAISAAALDSSTVFFAFGMGSSLYSKVATVSGTTISTGSAVTISSATGSANTISVAALSSTKALVVHSYSSDYRLYATVCSVSGTTISKGTDTAIINTAQAGRSISAVYVGGNSVFIAHSSGTNLYLHGITCSVSGTVVSYGTDVEISAEANSGYKMSAIKAVGVDRVVIAYDTSTHYLHGAVISGAKSGLIEVLSTTQLSSDQYSGEGSSVVTLSTGTGLVAHRIAQDFLYALPLTSIFKVQASVDSIDGLTKTECTTSTAGDVWVLNA